MLRLPKRWLRVVAGVLAGLVAILLLMPLLLTTYYHDELTSATRRFFRQYSSQRLEPFSVRLSVLTTFPNVALHLGGLSVRDTAGREVLAIDRARVVLRTVDLVRGRWPVRRAVLRGVRFSQWVDASGRRTMLVWRGDNPQRANSALHFIVPDLHLRDVTIHLRNQYKRSETQTRVAQAHLTLDGQGNTLLIRGNLRGSLHTFTNPRITLVRPQPFSADVHYQYNLRQRSGHFGQTRLYVNGHTLRLTGTHRAFPTRHKSFLNVTVAGSQPLGAVLAALRSDSASRYGFDTTRRDPLAFTFQMRGFTSPRLKPPNRLAVRATIGPYRLPGRSVQLDSLRLRADLFTDPHQTPWRTRLVLHECVAYQQRDTLTLRGTYQNAPRPLLTGTARGQLAVPLLLSLFNVPKATTYRGLARLDLSLNGQRYGGVVALYNAAGTLPAPLGRLDDVNTEIRLSGDVPLNPAPANWLVGLRSTVRLTAGRLHITPGQILRNVVMRVDKQNDQFRLARLRFRVGANGQGSGSGSMRWQNGRLQQPDLTLTLAYSTLNLTELLPLLTTFHRPAGGPATRKAPFAKNLRLNVVVQARQLQYEALRGSDFVLDATLAQSAMALRRLRLSAFGGQVAVRGRLSLAAAPAAYPVQLTTTLRSVDLTQFFRLADELHLDVLGSQNIRGQMDGGLLVSTTLNERFLPTMAQTTAYSNARLRHLELIGMEPIQQSLRFIKKSRTERIVFGDVHARLLLHQNRILLPAVSLNNSLSYLQLGGDYWLGQRAEFWTELSVMRLLFGSQRDSSAERLGQRPNLISKLLLHRPANSPAYRVKLTNHRVLRERQQSLQVAFEQELRRQRIDTAAAVW